MALTTRTKHIVEVALANKAAAIELCAAIDSGSNPVAAVVAAFGSTSNLTALVPATAALTALVPTATTFSLSAGTYVDGAHPTGAEVDTAINAGLDLVETAMGNKADNADVETLRGEVEDALDLKADNADVETLRGEVETRLDSIETKINAILTALKNAGLMATA
jgi:hypothetical protein